MTTTTKFKETDIGEIPVEWEVDEIGELFEIKQGKALSKKHREGKRPRPFLRTSNVYWGYTTISDLDEMDFTEEEEEKYQLKKNDLLICEGGAIGRTAILEEDLPGVYYQNHVFRVRANKKNIYPKYAMFWMDAAQNIFDHYSGTANKTTIANLSKSRLSNYKISIPPLSEQKAIAQKLTVIRNAIEQTQAVIEATETLKKSMMKHLFTYGPVPANQTDQVKLKETEIGLVPEEWEIKKIEELFEFSRKPRNLNINEDEEICFIPMDGISEINSEINYFEKKSWNEISSGSYVEKEDLIIAKITPSFENGKQAILYDLPDEFGYATTEVWAIHPKKKNEKLTKLVYYFIKQSPLRNEIANKMEGSTGRQRVPKSEISNLLIPVPDNDSLEKIIKTLIAIDKKIKVEKDKVAALESSFNSTLESLMSAKIRVN